MNSNGEEGMPHFVLSLLDQTGRATLLLLRQIRDAVDLLGQSVGWVVRGRWELQQTVVQMARVGVESLPIVIITGLFSGMVLAFQTARQFVQFGAQGFIGGLVAVSMAREAAPVFTAVVIAGRVGAGFAAEIGTMAVTEQIDALRALGTDPVRYLVVPRLNACLVMLPVLTLFSNLLGSVGGFWIATLQGVGPEVYIESVRQFMDLYDLTGGLIKAFAFGAIIAIIGCLRGITATGGAMGVGRSTTSAVVAAIVIILVGNYFLDVLLY